MKEVIQLYAVEFRVFCPFSSHPLRLKEIVAMHSIKFAMGSVVQKTLFNFMLLNSGYFVLSHPTPLRLQEIVAMHSIMLAMGSVVQKKLASAIRV